MAVGKGVTKNLEEAVKWYRKAAERGIVDAQFALSKCYWKGVGVSRDRVKATKLFLCGTWARIKKAPEWFWLLIFAILGVLFLHLVESWWSRKGSLKWRCWRLKCSEKRLRKAAEQGSSGAQSELDKLLSENPTLRE